MLALGGFRLPFVSGLLRWIRAVPGDRPRGGPRVFRRFASRIRRRATRTRSRPSIELRVEFLERRWVPDATQFAVIGDYGGGGTPEADVAALVHSWNPDLILTLG